MATINPIIKDYCKLHKLKFKENTQNGFTATATMYVCAGMEFGKGIYKIQPISKKLITRNFLLYPDNDIVTGEIVSTEFAEL